MKAATRQKFWRLHSLLGVALGLPLFIIFFAGSFAFFQQEALHWTHPELSHTTGSTSLNQAVADLEKREGPFRNISFRLASKDRPITDIFWNTEDNIRSNYWLIPGEDGDQLRPAPPHESDLAHFMVDLHYFDFLPVGKELTGILTMVFLSLIATGAIYQWRSYRRDLHLPKTLKTPRAKSSFWKKWHRFTSALTLPYQIALALTGGVLALGLLALAPAIFLFFDGDQDRLGDSVFPTRAIVPAQATTALKIDESLAAARDHWGQSITPSILQIITHPDDKTTIVIDGRQDGFRFLRQHFLVFDGETQVLKSTEPGEMLGAALIESIVNIHFGLFGNFWIKVLLAVLGLLVTLSIASGLQIILRRDHRPILAHLTNTALGGLPLATAAAFLTNLLAPNQTLTLFWLTSLLAFILQFPAPGLKLPLKLTTLLLTLTLATFYLKNGLTGTTLTHLFNLTLLTFAGLLFAISKNSSVTK